jgi:hypothetical protein
MQSRPFGFPLAIQLRLLTVVTRKRENPQSFQLFIGLLARLTCISYRLLGNGSPLFVSLTCWFFEMYTQKQEFTETCNRDE